MLELKTYQRDTLDAFSNYLEMLEKERQASETVKMKKPFEIISSFS